MKEFFAIYMRILIANYFTRMVQS